MTLAINSKRVGLSVLCSVALSLAGIGAVKSAPNPDIQPQLTAAISDVQLKPFVENYAEMVYRNYRATRKQADLMRDAINVFLAQPNASTQKAAKAAWVQARQSYLQTEAFRFYEGPIDFVDPNTGEEGPEGRINAWPMNEAFIDYVKGKPTSGLINKQGFKISIENILENDQVTDEADVTTGWHAIEFLLWGQDFNANGPGQRGYQDFVPNQGNNNRRRDYLKFVTEQLLKDLTFLEEAWKPGINNYRAQFVNRAPKANLSKIFTALATLSAFEMASERMAVALDSGDQEDEHSCFSDTTYQDFVFNAQGIYNVYMGRYGDYQGSGFNQLVAQVNPALNQRMIAALDQTNAKVAKIGQPFDQVLATPSGSPQRQQVEAAIQSLEDQAELFQEVGAALGIEVEILAE